MCLYREIQSPRSIVQAEVARDLFMFSNKYEKILYVYNRNLHNIQRSTAKYHSGKNAWIQSRILPYWDRLFPYIGIRRPYTRIYRIVFRRFSCSIVFLLDKLLFTLSLSGYTSDILCRQIQDEDPLHETDNIEKVLQENSNPTLLT